MLGRKDDADLPRPTVTAEEDRIAPHDPAERRVVTVSDDKLVRVLVKEAVFFPSPSEGLW
jgi:hypothetical protein